MTEGLVQLAGLHKARACQRAARTLIFNSIYSRNIDQIKADYKLAEKYDNKAKMLRESALNKMDERGAN